MPRPIITTNKHARSMKRRLLITEDSISIYIETQALPAPITAPTPVAASSTAWSFLQSQQSRVDGHNHRARGHQYRTQSGSEQNAPRVKRSGRQRNGDDVIARGPEKVLNHLPIRGARKLHDSHDIQRIAAHQNNVGG